jgi:hypothetical protein
VTLVKNRVWVLCEFCLCYFYQNLVSLLVGLFPWVLEELSLEFSFPEFSSFSFVALSVLSVGSLEVMINHIFKVLFGFSSGFVFSPLWVLFDSVCVLLRTSLSLPWLLFGRWSKFSLHYLSESFSRLLILEEFSFLFAPTFSLISLWVFSSSSL